MIAGSAETPTASQEKLKEEINRLDKSLERKFSDRLEVRRDLSRGLVSFQGNKTRPSYRWYKYKEGFSAALVDYLLDENRLTDGTILDPFAGSGTTLFAASERGLQADGIEVLPVSQQLIKQRKVLETEFGEQDFYDLQTFIAEKSWQKSDERIPINELRITRGAYPASNKDAIERFRHAAEKVSSRNVRDALEFALFCVLEQISFTLRDGQYLRWDDRSGRRVGTKRPYNKGVIPDFCSAITEKVSQITGDLQNGKTGGLFKEKNERGEINLFAGSCLDVMPFMNASVYDGLITSPPYCNRYDYTRTYALELAMLGTDEKGLSELRQKLLSCTVESKGKDLLAINANWQKAIEAADDQPLLQTILQYLEVEKNEKRLNNGGILRMVRGYFYEMACVILESARVLKRGAPLIMVNDNVRYAGVSISVDLILSDLAESLGFAVEKILVLPQGKGNSSQQMSAHGRESLRKCVYVWKKI